MRLIPRNKIIISDRQRKAAKSDSITDLRNSILSLSLLHPPVVAFKAPDSYILIAGFTRLTAIDQIAASNSVFRCDDKIISPGQVPVTLVTDLSSAELFAAELEENLIRTDLTWEDRIRAIATLAELRRADNPNITKTEIAQELIAAKGTTSTASLPTAITQITQAEAISKHLDDPDIAKSRSADEAYKKLLARESAKWTAELIRRTSANAKSSPKPYRIIHGDLLTEMKKLDDNSIDLILSDPPYGVNAHKVSSSSKMNVGHSHDYEDTPEYARKLYTSYLSEGFRICKPRANLFIFTDIDHFSWLKSYSQQMGWTPWRFPLIWQKSETDGVAVWARQGFIHTFEIIFWATKGQRGLYKTDLDIFTEKRVGRSERLHAAEKPVALLRRIIDLCTYPGDTVLDPCAGSGSVLQAAQELHRPSIGIELSQSFIDIATVRMDKLTEEPELDL